MVDGDSGRTGQAPASDVGILAGRADVIRDGCARLASCGSFGVARLAGKAWWRRHTTSRRRLQAPGGSCITHVPLGASRTGRVGWWPWLSGAMRPR